MDPDNLKQRIHDLKVIHDAIIATGKSLEELEQEYAQLCDLIKTVVLDYMVEEGIADVDDLPCDSMRRLAIFTRDNLL